MSRLTQQHDDDEDFDVLDHAVLDTLDDEDFASYMDDPKAFIEKHPEVKTEAGAEPPAATETDDPPPAIQPAEERTPDAKADADTDEADDDVVIENPWKDEGIPDIWMTDPETGEQFENGLILGKYRTPDAAFKGTLEAQKLIGRKRLDPEQGHVEQPRGFLQTAPLDPATDQSVWQHSYQYAMERYASDIDALGLSQEDFGENLEGLKAADPQLFREIKREAEQRYGVASQFVQNYVATSSQRDEIQGESMEQGYNLFVDAFEEATGLESDEEDQKNLEGAYNAVLTGILKMDKQYQDYTLQNPTANIYANPDVAQFYARYYEPVNGVFVLSPEKVAQAALAANDHLYRGAIKRSAVETYRAAQKKDIEETPPFPRTATTAQNEGAAGAGMPRPSEAEFYSPDYFDKLVKAFGDEDKAQQFYDRVADEMDEAWAKSAPRTRQRANY